MPGYCTPLKSWWLLTGFFMPRHTPNYPRVGISSVGRDCNFHHGLQEKLTPVGIIGPNWGPLKPLGIILAWCMKVSGAATFQSMHIMPRGGRNLSGWRSWSLYEGFKGQHLLSERRSLSDSKCWNLVAKTQREVRSTVIYFCRIFLFHWLSI